MSRGSLHTARLHREWLRAVLRKTGLSPTALARRVRIAPSTLTRPLREGEDGTSTLHAATIEKIAAFAGLAPPRPGESERLVPQFATDEAEPFVAEAHDAFASAVRQMLTAHPDSSAWRVRSRALELAGYLPGDVVLIAAQRPPRPGDVACARTVIEHQPRTVLRIVERIGASDVMVAATLDPSIVRHLPIDDRTELLGIVTGAVRPDPRTV